MLLVALVVLVATAAGITADQRTTVAPKVATRALTFMLYVLVPYVAYVGFARLHLSLDAGAGLLIAYLGIGLAGTLAWLLGRRIGLIGPSLGGLICCVILANTSYLGLPMAFALLGSTGLSHAIAYDQTVSTPLLFTAGFAVGAAFGQGDTQQAGVGRRLRTFLTRNPPLWGAVAGVIFRWAPSPLPAIFHVVVEVLLILGFFAVGVFLSSERREEAGAIFQLPDVAVWIAVGCRELINAGVLGVAAVAGLGIPDAYFLQAAMPSGIAGLIVGHAYGLDQRLIANVILWSTVLVVGVAVVAQLI